MTHLPMVMPWMTGIAAPLLYRLAGLQRLRA
jgi:hypothetical protein